MSSSSLLVGIKAGNFIITGKKLKKCKQDLSFKDFIKITS